MGTPLADLLRMLVQRRLMGTLGDLAATPARTSRDVTLPLPLGQAPDPRLQFSEPDFRRWYGTVSKQYDLGPNPDDPPQFYDYRAAYRAGALPDETQHWPSDFKREGHPNMIVGGFHVQTGQRVPGTRRAGYEELVRLGWEPATAARLVKAPEPK